MFRVGHRSLEKRRQVRGGRAEEFDELRLTTSPTVTCNLLARIVSDFCSPFLIPNFDASHDPALEYLQLGTVDSMMSYSSMSRPDSLRLQR